MEFHLWGKLDDKGHIQSVQSSCSNLPHDNSVVSPREWSSTSGTRPPEREMVYKLDAKIDEMSLIMMQMGELSKRVKIQDKLIQEYEDKARRQTFEISVLKEENARLHSSRRNIVRSRPQSFDGPLSVTEPKVVRSSVTNIKMTCSLQTDVEYTSSCSDKEYNIRRSSTDYCRDGSENSTPPSCHDCVGLDEVDSSIRGEVSKEFNIHLQKKSHTDDKSDTDDTTPSYKTSPYGIQDSAIKVGDTVGDYVMANNTHCAKPQTGLRKRSQSEPSVMYLKDGNGYLILSDIDGDCRKSTWLNETESEMSDSKKEMNNRYSEKKENCMEDVHASWSDINVSVKMQDHPHSIKKHISFKDQPDYVEIPDGHVPDIRHSPPPPRPKSLELCIDKYRNRPLPTPTEGSSNRIQPAESDRQISSPCHGANEDYSPNYHSHSAKILVNRHSSPDLRKTDTSNNLMQTMRTTLEWQTSKKELMFKSHTCTTEQVEEVLRRVVQNTHRACEEYEMNHKTPITRETAKRHIIQCLRKSVKNSCDEDILTDDFLRKCLEVWNTVKYNKTP